VYDVVIVGSGFGGALAAARLVDAGWSVAMLERGDWVARGPSNWNPEEIGPLTRHYSLASPFWLERARRRPRHIRTFFCIGGPSVFYGGVAFRFREGDFEHDPEVAADSNARWPITYRELEPYYAIAERWLGVAGDDTGDPTAPPRSGPYPAAPLPLSDLSARLAAAARELGWHPSRLPLAIASATPVDGGAACVQCATCDGFACAIEAKNDLATRVLPRLVERGLALVSGAVVRRLCVEGDRVTGVEFVDDASGEVRAMRAGSVVLAAGALGSAHLALTSELERLSSAPVAVGAYLTRHVNSAVFGVFRAPQNVGQRFVKQLAFNDFYGDPRAGRPRGGCIQQLATPPAGYVVSQVPPPLGWLAVPFLSRMAGLITIAEDQPQAANRVRLGAGRDRFGLPPLLVSHRYSERDRAADGRLRREAERLLRHAGGRLFYRHSIRTFSHALGTLRMGDDPRTAPVAPDGRFRGIANLFVADGSVLPRSGGVNPSLTIAANALRIADRMAAGSPDGGAGNGA
jgi:choline dehydrogenase-like flavoprotein